MATLSVTLPTPAPLPPSGEVDGRPVAHSHGRRGRPHFVDTKLGALIESRGYKVKDVVNGANLNPRTVSDYLSKRRPVSALNALALAKFFGVTVEEITE